MPPDAKKLDDLIALGERLGDGEDFAAVIAGGDFGAHERALVPGEGLGVQGADELGGHSYGFTQSQTSTGSRRRG